MTSLQFVIDTRQMLSGEVALPICISSMYVDRVAGFLMTTALRLTA
ncbi:hypothetical protein [Burkholderia sp. SRS-W-2-2016]|nr:hypothetical protein [Burkholderia sp. SRS-W-2-2016]